MNTDIDDMKAGWVADALVTRLSLVGLMTVGLREGLKKMVLKELTLLKIHRLDDHEEPRIYVLRSHHPDVKQCFIGYGSCGTGIADHTDTPEYYGHDLEASKPNPDTHLWEWRLTQAQMSRIVLLWAERVRWLKAQEPLKRKDYVDELALTEKLMELITATIIQ